ncbi:MAG: ATP-dependent DNA helicase RecG [Firmicutes bacterium]|nr:ATP-dependent DNA helicase RecG [Bacillota bacterium]
MLHEPVSSLKGVGPKKQAALKKLDIEFVEDFLYCYPRDYEDRSNHKKIDQLLDGESAYVTAKVLLVVKGGWRYGKKRTLKLLVEDETGQLEIVFFVQAGYLEKAFQQGSMYGFFGKVSVSKQGRYQMTHPDFQKIEETTAEGEGTAEENKILPVYPLVSGLTQKDMRRWSKLALEQQNQMEDYLTPATVERNRLCDLSYALNHIHYPGDREKYKEAKYRLIFDELLLLQAGLMMSRKKLEHQSSGITFSRDHKTQTFTDSLPYPLTGAQKRVLMEIEADMESPKVMNRLIQGDVGSGKTAVAAAALYKAVKSGYQGVLMAPTEILASQHYEGLSAQFEPFGIKVGFLSGTVGAKDRRERLEQLKQGDIHILIGTHALIQEDVEFQNLGLVITDEQHRFGVKQRSLLSEKGDHPDTLVMTATPIPRTLAVVLYGDLDISVIDELPPGRKPVTTKALSGKQRLQAYEFMAREIAKGRQAYVVAPLIEESEQLNARSATEVYEELCTMYPQIRSALLHGAMKQKEKDEIMARFYEGEIQLLVSTVVIEVGINVPNSTMMIIENAERFGLAQLHQLRGRVGRGEHQSYCLLISEQESAVSKQRAEIMASTNDGFVIAEEDLRLRGPGEFFGVRQHGVPELKLADLGKHAKILSAARKEANYILQEDPTLSFEEHQPLKQRIRSVFHQVEELQL